MSSAPTPSVKAHPSRTAGLLAAFGAHSLWGLFPLYFLALTPAGPFEIVGWRVLFALAFCVILLTVTRSWSRLIAIVRRPRTVLIMGAAGVLIFFNWLIYLYATLTGQVVEASLGYFINPIVTVFLGVVVLRERLRPLQWVAVGISVVAVLVLAIGHGTVPWIALALAFTFGLYGLVKNRVGGTVDAVSGLTLETAWVSPLAAVVLAIVASTSGLVFGSAGAFNTVAILAAGAVTAVPLLLFASAASRLPLTYMGLVQYVTPVLQFLIGTLLLGEDMPPERLFGFALVWVALILLSTDAITAGRRARRPPTEPTP
ncbi:EamA family transporter RarD [Herbiconiux sp. L3-i23]|uniref:EamA family transporter RarD n=1 Tax=Herbiconiux sp. L3-i23 TaxID=2905871 RepID=UPI00206432B9|nr:EamA family transporter RarD [Herbiconiux sp. L3-i23]BDI23825.1 protein RarD [Herbiconiux sp. L3-i23]